MCFPIYCDMKCVVATIEMPGNLSIVNGQLYLMMLQNSTRLGILILDNLPIPRVGAS